MSLYCRMNRYITYQYIRAGLGFVDSEKQQGVVFAAALRPFLTTWCKWQKKILAVFLFSSLQVTKTQQRISKVAISQFDKFTNETLGKYLQKFLARYGCFGKSKFPYQDSLASFLLFFYVLLKMAVRVTGYDDKYSRRSSVLFCFASFVFLSQRCWRTL